MGDRRASVPALTFPVCHTVLSDDVQSVQCMSHCTSADGPRLAPITITFYGFTSNYRIMQVGPRRDVGSSVKNKTGNASKIETDNCPFIAF